MTLTGEQQLIYDKVVGTLKDPYATNEVVHVDAKAGTGKTTLTKHIVDTNPDASFIYTAFNRKIVQDGVPKFGKDHCKTFHAFARQYTPNPNIGGFYVPTVKIPGLTFIQKKYIVDMLDKYCLSKHLDVDDFFDENHVYPDLQDYIVEYLDKMANRDMPITFNYMLKELHHRLASGDITISIDLLFVDEAQDLTPVMLEIFGLISATVKVYLGDTSQDIYSFLDLVSAFTLSKSTYNLTESFRLSGPIAKQIEPFCKRHIDKDFRLVGLNMTPTDPSEAFITHSNAEIIYQVAERQRLDLSYTFTKPVKEIFETALAVNEIINHNYSRKPKYWTLVDLVKKRYTLRDLADSEELDDDIISSLKLLIALRKKGTKITDVMSEAENSIPDPLYLVGTAHSVKGLEFGCVTISSGLNKYVESHIKSTPMSQEEEDEIVEACKLYYVACSRAKHKLINATMLKE